MGNNKQKIIRILNSFILNYFYSKVYPNELINKEEFFENEYVLDSAMKWMGYIRSEAVKNIIVVDDFFREELTNFDFKKHDPEGGIFCGIIIDEDLNYMYFFDSLNIYECECFVVFRDENLIGFSGNSNEFKYVDYKELCDVSNEGVLESHDFTEKGIREYLYNYVYGVEFLKRK